MPCENCHVQFTVFRRKRSCYGCKRFYCNNCLFATKRNGLLCQRCCIFAARPLLRKDLLQLKAKDLIFYLQSKHISTAGCVEKEELVSLVLAHVQQTDNVHTPTAPGPNTNGGSADQNSFDSLKQTCQNFFSNITDNISDSFASFETKTTGKSGNRNDSTQHQQQQQSNSTSGLIHEQPRVSTREMPTYASFQRAGNDPSSALHSPNSFNDDNAVHSTEPIDALASNSSSSQTASSIISLNSSPSLQPGTNVPIKQQSTINLSPPHNEIVDRSDCECSDDELIVEFSDRHSVKTQDERSNVALSVPEQNKQQVQRQQQRQQHELSVDGGVGGTSNSTISTSPGYSKQGSLSSKVDICNADESSQSSFEELGAIGGISDDSKAATDTNSSNLDQWQILDVQKLENTEEVEAQKPENTIGTLPEDEDETLQVTLLHRNQPDTDLFQESTTMLQTQRPILPQRTKKVLRRRSDGYLNRRRPMSDDDSPVNNGYNLRTLGELTENETQQQQQQLLRSKCQRCGKNRTNIRKEVEKMRRHLEDAQMSEENIKNELEAFLSYLEQRTKSMDCSDSESRAVSSLSGDAGGSGNAHTANVSPLQQMQFDDNDGINVYAAPSSYGALDSRFINLDDFDTVDELESLTVKQLKEVLMLHRVDYKGCCEKQELFDRVQRLWKNLRSAPAVEKLPTDELCKICMDAPIECVILECGHMATCTNCGKVLSECPICRQYIVRVVRFFRA